MLSFSTPPKNICILRLSAIGDICHTLPIVRTIQSHWPETKITWVIGKTEYGLVKGITDIDFVVFDKKTGAKEYLKIYALLKHIKFDVLLHMQMSLRSSLISLMIKSKIKVGFDRERAKDGQWLFTNNKIKAQSQQHVMESLFGFSEYLGIKEHKYNWDIPISKEENDSAKNLLGDISKYILISPCSSKAYRNWNIQGYAAIADYIKENYHYDVILTGGNSEIEHRYATEIYDTCTHKPLNLIGKTSLKELLAIIKNATCMISPDSGPAHMSSAMNTPVIGLYATTNPQRARPYLSSDWTVNRYPEAIYRKYDKSVENVAWGARVRDDWAMNIISIRDVTKMIDKFFKQLPESK